ncbi:MAG: DHH family phosphoesterase [Methylovulum sp.]|nr:DHH family phosphoesterase [Methylovulum sp.]
MQIDVFNGDADGICALVQLRLAQPAQAKLVTGIKRDIQLLDGVSVAPDDQVTVLDISLEKNRTALDRILSQGAHVFYVDHHQPGEIPEHPHLKTLINTDANICTSLLVDQHLEGRYRAWAVTAAFGDNLIASAEAAAKPLGLSQDQLNQLNDLGVCINYNGYGGSLSDLHFAPDVLFRELAPYASPFDFMTDNTASYQQLLGGYSDDMAQALQITPEYETDSIGVYILPDVAWARRISGVFGNELANRTPSRAHAVFSFTEKGDYQISVRAPLTNKTGADELCSAFPTGGGRKSAAGINHLPLDQLSTFITAFAEKYR